uniref:Uncharacterized protein n=1 Tax=Globodera rostochiensis TaxID=31243 RepID=A0A914HCB0_GLORO
MMTTVTPSSNAAAPAHFTTTSRVPPSHMHAALLLLLLLCSSVHICCSSNTVPSNAGISTGELCGAQGRLLLMPPNQTVLQCQHDSDCLPPAACDARSRVCCVQPLDQEAPPVGCPKGTRQLQNANGEWLSCEPTRPSSCPGGALCYEDSLDGQYRCCGKDPGEGCGTGQRVLRHANNGSVQLCVPGALPECPGNAVCEWSFSIDRFQCCEPDSGCPAGEVPMFDINDEVLTCSPQRPTACPQAAHCRFNFWTAENQCCAAARQENKISSSDGQKLILYNKDCPSGEIPYIELGTTELKHCEDTMDCPLEYRCHRRICCGPTGQCPRQAEHPLHDDHGNVRLCLLMRPEVCPDNSKCRETLHALSGTPTGQRVCCGVMASFFECAASAGGQPFPTAEYPQVCEMDNPVQCPQDTICQASSVPGVSICCTGGDVQRRALCPKGWSAPDKLNIFCHPTIRGSCPSFAACLLSPVTQQFVCCEPGDDDDEELMHHHLRKHHHPRTRQRDHSQTERSVSVHSLSCPNQDDRMELLNNGNARHCTIDGRVPCSDGFICERSTENARVAVCCSAQRAPSRRVQRPQHGRDEPTYRCPSGAQVPVLRNGQNVFCDLGAQRCPSGSSCASALNAFGMMICCRNARQTLPLCPVGMQPETSAIGYVPCDFLAPDQCSEGYQCVHSRDDPETNICCSRLRNQPPSPATTPICPNQQILLRDGASPRYCSPRQGISACPNGYQCEESLVQPNVFVCCSIPALVMCPQGFESSLDLRTQNPIRCSPMDVSMCPAEAQCLEAMNRANEFLCCESTEPGRVCPLPGQAALLRPNGRPEECSEPGSPCSKSSYTCQLSNVLNRYVCCGTPTAVVLCADGRETYQQEPGRVVQCNPINWPNECPAGYECALSNRPGIHVCCRRLPAPPNPNVPNTDMPPPPPLQPPTQQPPASITFRPPVDELTCPVGWSAYEDQRGAHHFCQDALDMTCPHGFSCAQSSVSGIFMCCRLASSIQCPRDYSTLMVNNNPRLCSLTVLRRSVVTYPGASGIVPSSLATRTATSAADTPHTCPNGYTCMQSSVPAVYVCCGSSGLGIAGGFGSGILPPAPPQPPAVPAPLMPALPPGTSGLITTGQAGQPYCLDGQIPAYLGQLMRYCVMLGQASECPPSYVCAMSNRAGLYVCCHPFPVVRRTSMAQQMRDYSSLTKPIIAHCPDNREPYRIPDTGELLSCGPDLPDAQRQCPHNFVCKRGVQQLRAKDTPRVCCSPIAFCPGARLPQVDTRTHQAKRCLLDAVHSNDRASPTDDASRGDHGQGTAAHCTPPFTCQPSTVPDIAVCCKSLAGI